MPVHPKYHDMIGEHPDHPGEGQGGGARRRKSHKRREEQGKLFADA